MLENTFLKKPSFHVGGTVPVGLLINRNDELQESRRTLLERKGNVLLVGKRKIGKTSLVRKIKDEIERERALSVEINLVPYDQDPSSFLREILLLLCYEVGDKVFRKTTAELLASLGGKPRSLKGDFGRFYQVYKLTRALTISRTSQTSGEFHLDLPGLPGGRASKGKEERVDVGILQPYEFIELAQELMGICRKAGYESTVVFADEANRLAAQTSKDLLRSYFEVFASRQIQFVFVADLSLIDYRPIEDIFECTIKLGPFHDVENVRELLDRYYKKVGLDYSSVFTAESVEKVWELSKGHPYLVQLLCNSAVDEAHARNQAIVKPEDVMQAWTKALQKDHRLLDLWE